MNEKQNEPLIFFSNSDLKLLIIPLFIEQILAISVGMIDTMMISYAGEAAISGVALVDLINVLLINVFAAIATGGAVVTSQYLGKGDRKRCCESANQLILVTAVISLGIMVFILVLKRSFLTLLYHSISDDVMENALTYLRISAYSYPFLAIFNSCAALFRSMGNSKISMKVSLAMNVMNILGNAVLIFGFDMGIAGAAWASTASRIMASLVLFYLVQDQKNTIYVVPKDIFKWNGVLVRKILYIGIPGGIESGLFQLGRVVVVAIIANFGTVQIAANAVANNLDNMGCIGGQAMNLAMVAVIGRCIGAKDYAQVKYYVKKMMKITYVLGTLTNGLVLITMPLILKVYSLSPETAGLAVILVLIHCGLGIIMWPPAFTLPNALRAAGDVKITMGISVFSMFVFRIVFSVILGIYCGMGAVGVWIAMIFDWIFRLTMFAWRYRSGKWKEIHLVG
ncbi:MAG: MATE family efflux transporter [Clostridium sp.]